MRTILKSSFFWEVAGGFVLGTLGVLALQPANAAFAARTPVSATMAAAR